MEFFNRDSFWWRPIPGGIAVVMAVLYLVGWWALHYVVNGD